MKKNYRNREILLNAVVFCVIPMKRESTSTLKSWQLKTSTANLFAPLLLEQALSGLGFPLPVLSVARLTKGSVRFPL